MEYTKEVVNQYFEIREFDELYEEYTISEQEKNDEKLL